MFWEKTSEFISKLGKFRPGQIEMTELGNGEVDLKRADIWDGLWSKGYLLGWQDIADPLQNEVVTSLKILKERLSGTQLRGFQFLARGSIGGNEKALIVEGTVDRFNGMYLYQKGANARLGLAYLVRGIRSAVDDDVWALYLQSVIHACRAYQSDQHIAGNVDPIIYLLECSDDALTVIMRNAFTEHLEKFIEVKWNSILEHNALLNDDEFHGAILSLCAALPSRRIPYLIEAQHFVKKGMMNKARSALTSGVAAMVRPEETGNMKFTLYSFEKQMGKFVSNEESIFKLEEIVSLVKSDPDPVIELAQCYIKAGYSEKASALLVKALKDMPEDARKEIQKEIDAERAKIP